MSNPPFKSEKERFYGRRHGKKIKGSHLYLMEQFLPEVALSVPTQPIHPRDYFPTHPNKLCLEVGFGGGEHLAELAAREPHTGFIGAEPFLNGVVSLLAHLNGTWGKSADDTRLWAEGRGDNVRIFADDIRLLFPFWPDSVFDEIFVLYPDPWPKKRHANRRFIGQSNLRELHRLLKADGELQIATDVEDYATWAREQVAESQLFEQTNGDVRQPPKGWISTRYEQKGLAAGRRPTYLIYRPIKNNA